MKPKKPAISDKMRLDWIANNLSSSCFSKGPVTWSFVDKLPAHDIFENPRERRVRKAIDAAIKAERNTK